MPYDRFLIGFVDGNASLQTDLRPFLINDNAFAKLKNLYVFRGRVRKRFGGTLMGNGWDSSLEAPLFSRASIQVGVTAGGALSGNVRTLTGHPTMATKVGQAFSVDIPVNPGANGVIIFTVFNPAAGVQQMLRTDGSASTATYNLTNSDFNLTNMRDALGNLLPDGTPVYFYTAEPIMGLTVYERGPINNQPSYAFDTEFAYVFNGFFWVRSGTGANPIWRGTNNNYFWACNWVGITPNVLVLFVTNFNASVPTPAATDDPIWWTADGATWTSGTGNNRFFFKPNGGAIHTGPYVQTAKIIVPFKNRLVLLNTIENDNSGGAGVNSQYVNRCRFSHNGSPFAQNAWYEPNQTDSSGVGSLARADGAGFVDASTDEAIVSAEFIKDRLIVFFERSTWELAYTGNQVLPFVWQKLNTELGSQSQFSSVPFDREILTVGNTGIHSCNGSNVSRIDNKIPDEIFEIGNANSTSSRVAGIRDYYVEQVYWSFPSDDENALEQYCNRVLVYNYKTGAWGMNDDCIMVFGYYSDQLYTAWVNTLLAWEQANFNWSSGNEAPKFREVIAGNQQGYIFIVNPDVSRNAPVMQITQITVSAPNIILTIVDHTLSVGEYVLIENAQGIVGLNNNIYAVVSVLTANTVAVGAASFTGVYTGGGTATRVSNTQLLTKQYNFYLDKAQNIFLSKADFGVLKTSAGQVTVDYYPSASELSMLQAATATNSIMGNGVLETYPYDPNIYPFEQVQDRLWHSIYFQTNGDCIQLFIYMNPAQITNPSIALSDFELDAMVFYVTPNGRLQ